MCLTLFPCFILQRVSRVGHLQTSKQGGLWETRFCLKVDSEWEKLLSLEGALQEAMGVSKNKTGDVVPKGTQAYEESGSHQGILASLEFAVCS